MPYRVAITSRLFTLYPPATETLKNAGCEIVYNIADALDEDTVSTLLADADGYIAGLPRVTESVLQRALRLKVICRSGVGYDTIDVDACTRHRVAVCTTPGANHHSVADSAMMFVLALGRKLLQNDANVHRGEWRRDVGMEIWEKTIGIVGTGRIGKEVTRRARGFNMTVLAYDVFQDPEWAAREGVTYVGIEELLRRSDFVTLHAPMTPESHNLINARTLALMKPTAYLINTARGGLVDEDALYDALKEKRIAGAGLDVFVEEPPTKPQKLVTLDNAIFMPHAAGWSHEANRRTAELAAGSILDGMQGKKPHGLINTELYAG